MNTLLSTPTFIAALCTLLIALATLLTALSARLTANDTNAKVTDTQQHAVDNKAALQLISEQTNGTAQALQARIDTLEFTLREMRELGLTPKTVPVPVDKPPDPPK